MSVFREVSFQWRGETLSVVPDIALLRRIKGRGVNNLRLAHECMTVGPDPSELAVALSAFLHAAGKRVSEDDAYADLVGDDHAAVLSFQEAYVQAVVPNIDLGKKPEAPAQEAKGPGPKRRKK